MADASNPPTEMSGGQVSKEGEHTTSSVGQPSEAVPMTDLSQSAAPVSTSTPDATQPAASSSSTSPTAANDASATGAATTMSTADANDPTHPPDSVISTGEKPEEQSAREHSSSAAPAPPAKPNREDSMAIGPSVDHVQPVDGPDSAHDGLVCNITLLLITGARHPYRIDERYLAKRNVPIPGRTDDGSDRPDPFTISVYTLKELILREWREEWDPKPASPSSIRLIHFGKLLEDKDQLKQYHFSAETANVVHMTVRPADLVEEEEPKGKGGKTSGIRRASRTPGGGGGCCVIL